MENKINVAEILKNCPQDMELYCTMFDNVTFIKIQDNSYPIIIHTPDGCKYLTAFGCYHSSHSAKCVIFPKGKTTWEGFVPPCEFKDGDIICNSKTKQPFILKFFDLLNNNIHSYCGIDGSNKFYTSSNNWAYDSDVRLATEEEKQKLFKAIKDNGYKWNEVTKTLEKLIKPKFKIGDEIVKRNSINNSWIVSSVSSEYYGLKLPNGSEGIGVLTVSEQDAWELVPSKFDINTLKPFDKVLVRYKDNKPWTCDFFGFISKDYQDITTFVCVGHYAKQCIPYQGNEHLLGMSDDCLEYFKTWK